MWKWKEWPRWTRRVMKFPQPHLLRAAANSREWSVVWKPRIYGTNSTNWAQRWSSLKPGGESQADSPPRCAWRVTNATVREKNRPRAQKQWRQMTRHLFVLLSTLLIIIEIKFTDNIQLAWNRENKIPSLFKSLQKFIASLNLITHTAPVKMCATKVQ